MSALDRPQAQAAAPPGFTYNDEAYHQHQHIIDKLKQNREKVPLELLTTKYSKGYKALLAEAGTAAIWMAHAYLAHLTMPIHPKDQTGNDWLAKRVEAINAEEMKPGGLYEKAQAAITESLDIYACFEIAYQIYQRIEDEAFLPYWYRHCRELESGWIYNDITGKFWAPPEKAMEALGDAWTHGAWITKDWTEPDSRFPPEKRKENENGQKDRHPM